MSWTFHSDWFSFSPRIAPLNFSSVSGDKRHESRVVSAKARRELALTRREFRSLPPSSFLSAKVTLYMTSPLFVCQRQLLCEFHCMLQNSLERSLQRFKFICEKNIFDVFRFCSLLLFFTGWGVIRSKEEIRFFTGISWIRRNFWNVEWLSELVG